ncbi:MAG: hypothetical protein WC043_10130 [Pseudobdellovibrionaceae bacterium]
MVDISTQEANRRADVCGIKSSDDSSQRIKVGLLEQFYEEDRGVASISSAARVTKEQAQCFADGGPKDKGWLSSAFDKARDAASSILTPKPSADMSGTCADVRRTYESGGTINNAAAGYCGIKLNP